MQHLWTKWKLSKATVQQFPSEEFAPQNVENMFEGSWKIQQSLEMEPLGAIKDLESKVYGGHLDVGLAFFHDDPQHETTSQMERWSLTAPPWPS